MPFYLHQVSYTPEALTRLIADPHDRFEAVRVPIEKLGGKICMPKTAVPQMGYFVVCNDTENNTFALWEWNESAQ